MEEENLVKKEKRVRTEEEMRLERLSDSRSKLKVIHMLRWNLNVIFSDVGDTEEYIEANETLSEMERLVWKYIDEGIEY